MSELLLSVIVINYNKDKYIEACIQSIIAQPIKLELIIVDDGSSDGSRAIIEQYQKNNDNIFYYFQENSGPSAARNKGLDHAKGKYVIFIDSDDLAFRTGFSTLINLVDKNEACMAIGNIKCFNEEKEWYISYMKDVFQKNLPLIRFVGKNPELHLSPSASNKVFRLSLIKEFSIRFKENLRVGEDLLFTQEYLLHTKKVVVKNVDVLKYRFLGGSDSLIKSSNIGFFQNLYTVQMYINKLYKNLGMNKEKVHIEKRQIKFFLDSFMQKAHLIQESDRGQLWQVGHDFLNCIENKVFFEHLDQIHFFIINVFLYGNKEELKLLLSLRENNRISKVNIIKDNEYYHYLYNYFKQYKELLKLTNFTVKLYVEKLKIQNGFLSTSGYIYIEGMPAPKLKKQLKFTNKNTEETVTIDLEDVLRTDITYLKSRNTVNYDQSGFSISNLNLSSFLSTGDWYTEIEIKNEEFNLSKPFDVSLMKLKNNALPSMIKNKQLVPRFDKNILHVMIRSVTLKNTISLLKQKLIRNIKVDLRFLIKKDFQSLFVLYLFRLFKGFYRKQNIWLIGERPDTAQDNSYHFFSFVRKNYPKTNIYYVIDENSSDFDRIKTLGNYIKFGSLKHSFYLLVCKKTINSYEEQANMYTDSYRKIILYLPESQKNEKIFIQHGVIGVSRVNHSLHKNRTDYSKFVVSSPFEKEHIVKEFGFKEDEVIITGLPRWDALEDTRKRKEILLMPTWRSWIQSPSELEKSNYLQTYRKLLMNTKFHKLLEVHDLTVTFYPHYQIQKLWQETPNFHPRITVMKQGEETVQSLLKRHSLLITDYSTVSFDFVYMNKPVVFYQFDYDEFYSNHYNEGPINHKEDLFGKVCETEEELLTEVKRLINNSLTIDEQYLEKSNKYIVRMHGQHCLKLYDEIIK
ncbi:CDP-glycerol:glycerophosphate glycerophosphotransferase [Gottfriedia acidiceleris]|uniref:CDP-glycerol:glycerophosphate glycerophosphotransferase n=1 Tax=Gottfriedia acidiceleris TaxID=371036 RepID=UPI002FFDC9AD